MKAKQTIHILTDKKGAIMGGGILASTKDRKGKGVHVQMTPMKGQTMTEVPLPDDFQRLKGAELFCRLQMEYRLPRGKKELVRKSGRR